MSHCERNYFLWCIAVYFLCEMLPTVLKSLIVNGNHEQEIELIIVNNEFNDKQSLIYQK